MPIFRLSTKRSVTMSKIIDDNIPFLRNLRLAAEANSEEDLNPLFDMLDPDPDSKKMGKDVQRRPGIQSRHLLYGRGRSFRIL